MKRILPIISLILCFLMTRAAFADAGVAELVVPNEPVKGVILLEKQGQRLTSFKENKDAHGYTVHTPVFENGRLDGAVFEVRAAEDIVGKDGTVWFKAGEVADTITTTNDGADTSKPLPLGNYKVVEVEAPSGYILDKIAHDARLSSIDQKTPLVDVTIQAENAYLPAKVSLHKEKEVLTTNRGSNTVQQKIVSVPGEGFVFGLFSAEDITRDGVTLAKDTLVMTGSTDKDGNLTFDCLVPHGRYYVRELAAPHGWKLNPKRFPVAIMPNAAKDDVIAVSLAETVHDELIYGRITLTKRDISGKETVAGALIEVYDASGDVYWRAYTDRNGRIADIPVTPGKYTFREVIAPEGFVLNDAVMTFSVDDQGNVTGDHEIRDDFTRLFVKKQDENGDPLEGVEFGLFRANGAEIQRALSDENGMVKFERIPYGEFIIRETKALPGYVKNENVQRVTLDSKFQNKTEPIAVFTNRKMKVQGVKVDTSGRKLAGVEFVLIDEKTDRIVESVFSDEKGVFTFKKLDYGDWIIRESRAPEGYNLMPDVKIHVDGKWTEPEPITCVDIPNIFDFMKVDNHGRKLAGVRFSLENEKGEVLRDDLKSGEDGVVHVTGLKPGKYTIRELETVEGYSLTEETLNVTIDENYIVAKKMPKLKNYPTVQTGVDFVFTPLTWAGIGTAGAGMIGIAVWLIASRKKRRK